MSLSYPMSATGDQVLTIANAVRFVLAIPNGLWETRPEYSSGGAINRARDKFFCWSCILMIVIAILAGPLCRGDILADPR